MHFLLKIVVFLGGQELLEVIAKFEDIYSIYDIIVQFLHFEIGSFANQEDVDVLMEWKFMDLFEDGNDAVLHEQHNFITPLDIDLQVFHVGLFHFLFDVHFV